MHSKRHTKKKTKRCARPVKKRHAPVRSGTTGGNGSNDETGEDPEPEDVARCNRKQALDPAAFIIKYGVGPDSVEALETCLLGPDDDGSDDDSG